MKVRALVLCWMMVIFQYAAGQSLEADFRIPPSESKPIMIWQWMNGLVTKEGITADLEAYKEAGIGGVQNFQIGGELQCLVGDTANAIGTDNWKQLMQFAISECKRLGLSFGTHNCPGWSSSAYPTMKPEYSMQKLVWTDTIVSGGRKLALNLPQPQVDPQWNYYRDIAVFATPADSLVSLNDIRIISQGHPSPITQLPKGRWRIIRFGHTTNGKTNWGTAPESGVGLECDKMSREAVKQFWDSYPTMLIELAGAETGKTFLRLEIDSYEAGGQEWTKQMPEEFLKRRGYDMIRWLPAIAGVTIGDSQSTRKFKDDWKETVCDLFAENYYGYMSQLAHQHGLKLLVQPYGTGGSKPFNPINTDKIVRQLASDDPICAEFWTKPESWGWPDVPRVVKAAHQVGRQKVYAEGFTCWPLYAWKSDPDELKRTGDRAFCLGINALMLHAAAHNPWLQAKPGMTFGMWGTWWSPGQTWWKNGASALFNYFARCQTLLQQGEYVDDFKSSRQSLHGGPKALQWIHRQNGDTDIFFIANAQDTTFTTTLSFDIADRQPEIWNPEAGDMTNAQAWQQADGGTKIALHFDANQSLFIVFRNKAYDSAPRLDFKQPEVLDQMSITTPWSITFNDSLTVTTDTLFAWNEHPTPDIRYFSGTANYSTTLKLKLKNNAFRYILDLGDVKNLAVVSVNGMQCANLWHAPFKADITGALHQGENTIAIGVTNLWVNRMIGDEEEPDDVEWSEPFSFGGAAGRPDIGRFMKRVPDWLQQGKPRPSKNRQAVISFKFYEKDAQLLPSGLLGPVVIKMVGATTSAQNHPFKNKNIVVIGDSYVRNHRRPVEETWHARVAERLGMNYRNYGINGNSIAFDRTKQGFGKSMLERYQEMTDSADFVLVIAGHNDAFMIRDNCDSLALFRLRLDSLCVGLKHKYPQAKIGFVTPWAVERPGFIEVTQTIRDVCAQHNIFVLDAARTSGILPMDTAFRKKYFQALNDTAHLNAEGHALLLNWGEKFLRMLAK